MSVEPLKVAASFVDVNVVYLIPPAHVQFFENALGLKFENQAMLYQTWKEKGTNSPFWSKSSVTRKMDRVLLLLIVKQCINCTLSAFYKTIVTFFDYHPQAIALKTWYSS